MAGSAAESEEELLQRLQTGDEAAFAALYARLQARVPLRRWLSGSARRGDVTQETSALIREPRLRRRQGSAGIVSVRHRAQPRAAAPREGDEPRGVGLALQRWGIRRRALGAGVARARRPRLEGGAGTAAALPGGRRALRAREPELQRRGDSARLRRGHGAVAPASRSRAARREAAQPDPSQAAQDAGEGTKPGRNYDAV